MNKEERRREWWQPKESQRFDEQRMRNETDFRTDREGRERKRKRGGLNDQRCGHLGSRRRRRRRLRHHHGGSPRMVQPN